MTQVVGFQEKFIAIYNVNGSFAVQAVNLNDASLIYADRNTPIDIASNRLDARFPSIRDNQIAKACTVINPLTWPGDLAKLKSQLS